MFNQILLVFLLTKMRFGYSVKQILIIFSPSVHQNQNDSSYNKLGFHFTLNFKEQKKKPADFKVIKTKIIKPNTDCFLKIISHSIPDVQQFFILPHFCWNSSLKLSIKWTPTSTNSNLPLLLWSEDQSAKLSTASFNTNIF